VADLEWWEEKRSGAVGKRIGREGAVHWEERRSGAVQWVVAWQLFFHLTLERARVLDVYPRRYITCFAGGNDFTPGASELDHRR
jgi:hypothetical protein